MNERLPLLREKTSKLTTAPGVYLMKDKSGEIIYIGKAKNLKNRVSSYFREGADHLPKVASMVSHVWDYSFIVTDSEYEALVLECSLIKQHQPHYNILLKDDKGYSYLCFSDEPYPRLTAEKNKKKPGRYLGPYMSGFVTKETARETNLVFRLPTCNRRFPQDIGKERPCLNYHIKQCMGLCRGEISQAQYAQIIEQAMDYIRMGSAASVERMQAEMERAAESLDFERAAMLRDRIKAVSRAGESQKIMDSALEEADIIACAQNSGLQCISVLRYRGRRLFDKEAFFFEERVTQQELMQSFLTQYYNLHRSELPSRVILDQSLEEASMLEQLFTEYRGRRVHLIVPQRGTLRPFIELSKRNAAEELAVRFGRTSKEIKALEELGIALGLEKPPVYIESYDISNLSNDSIVCGMVVYENGRPLKKAYKRFKMKQTLAQDDYACMYEAIERRLRHYLAQDEEGFSRCPDLILLDGGTGHVNTIRPLVQALGLQIPVFGMVKDQKHRTRAIADGGAEIGFSATSAAFHLLTRIQDEVHRYSVAYMHSVHRKNAYHLELTNIRGIGEKKAQRLLLHYKTVDAMAQADASELAQVAGVSSSVGEEIAALVRELAADKQAQLEQQQAAQGN